MERSTAVDRVFAAPLERVGDFTFDEHGATVFYDMVGRSVPHYQDIQRMLAELAASFATDDSNIYDLGCSTGTTLALIRRALPVRANLIGIDSSPEMLERCRSKLEQLGVCSDIDLRRADLDEGVEIRDASVVVFVLTLMFVRPLNRLLLVENVLGDGSLFNRLLKEYSAPLGLALPIVLIGLWNLRQAGGFAMRPVAVATLCSVFAVAAFFWLTVGALKKTRTLVPEPVEG